MKSKSKLLSMVLAGGLIIGCISDLGGAARVHAAASSSVPHLENPKVTYKDIGTVEFGHYLQEDTNGDGSFDENDEKKPIVWRILDTDENGVSLLAADKIIDARKLHTVKKIDSYKESDLYKWLNSSEDEGFLKEAFTTEEQALIEDTEGDETGEKVFFLSKADVNNAAYGFGDKQDRVAKPTGYVKSLKGDNVSYYLSDMSAPDPSKKYSSYKIYTVTSAGNTSNTTFYTTDRTGVRPAIRIKLSSIPQAKRDHKNGDIESVEYSTIRLGKYNGKPITWRVLQVGKNDALLLSEEALLSSEYHYLGGLPDGTVYRGIKWDNCALRSWLNGDGFLKNESVFSGNERSLIKETSLETGIGHFDGLTPITTKDYIFLLSEKDVVKPEYGFSVNIYSKSVPRIAKNADGNAVSWWLRDNGYGNEYKYVMSVKDNGEVDIDQSGLSCYANWVRPAMRIDPSKIVLATGVTLNTTSDRINVGDTLQLSAKLAPENVTTDGVTWESDTPNVATVDDNGLVTAVSEGIVKITAEAADSSGVTAVCTLTVKKPITKPYPENPRINYVSRDTVEFGHYIQEDTNGDGIFDEKDEKKPIVWRILDTEDNGRSLLISDKVLDYKKYNNNGGAVGSWKDCDLHKWLNSEENGFNETGFLKTAFTDEEQALIETVNLANSDNINTADKVFLLSNNEAKNASNGLDENIQREAEATDYVEQIRGYDSDKMSYGLRTHGINKVKATKKETPFVYIVGTNGTVSTSSNVTESSYGIRPAICIRLSSIPEAVYGKANVYVKDAEYDTVTLGSYNGKPITWRILHAEKNDAFLLSEYTLKNMEYKHYDEAGEKEVSWERSDIRRWLNGNGYSWWDKPYLYKDGFTDEERSAIKLSDVQPVDNPNSHHTEKGAATKDYLFLLSAADILNTSYGFSPFMHISPETRVAMDTSNTATSWWTRTSGETMAHVTVIGPNGRQHPDSPYVYPTNKGTTKREFGVRPAMHVDLSNPIFGLNFAQKVELNKTSEELIAGDELRLSAKVTPADALYTDVIWSSDKPEVATVDENGLVKTLSEGNARITAVIDDGTGKKAECTVKVSKVQEPEQESPKIPDVVPEPEPEPAIIPEMTLNTTLVTLQVNQSTSAIRAILVNDEIKSVTSNNTQTVKASFAGDAITLTAGAGAGDTTVDVVSASGIKRTIDVEVQKEAVVTQGISLLSTSVTIPGPGETESVKVSAYPDAKSTGEPIILSLNNKSSGVIDAQYDPSTGCINIRGKKKGTASIKITAGKKSKKLKVTVKDHFMGLGASDVTMHEGSSDRVPVFLENDSVKSVTSSDKSKSKIYSVTYEDGVLNIVAGNKTGKATVTVKSKSGISKRLTVNVQKGDITTKTLTLGKKSVSVAKRGASVAVKVKVSPGIHSTGENVNISMTEEDAYIVNAEYSDGNVIITARRKGKAKVNVTVGTKTATINVNVKK